MPSPPTPPLAEQTILITGASGTLGSHLTRTLITHGSRVITLYRNHLPEIPTSTRHTPIHCDISSAESRASAFETIHNHTSRIHTLIHTVGISLNTLLPNSTDHQWQKIFHTNTLATHHLIQHTIPFMTPFNQGSIITYSSLAATHPRPGQSLYAASKATLEDLTRKFATELAPHHIRVNAIAPGFVESPMTQALSEKTRQSILPRIPLNHFASPADITPTALFLASSSANYITGQIIHVDGGYSVC